MKTDWKIEIIRKLPWSATFLLAAFILFKYTDEDLAAWISFVVSIIALFLVIRFEYYEKIIDRQENQIDYYIQKAMDSQAGAMKNMSEANTAIASNISGKYRKESDSQTKTR